MLRKHCLKPSVEMLCGLSIFCVIIATWLVTGLCVNIHKTGRLSESIQAVGYFRHLKDEKEELKRINKLLLCWYVIM